MEQVKSSSIENQKISNSHHYHNLLPTYLQDVLKRAVNQEEGEKRFESPAYVGQLDRAVKRVREGFPQAFKQPDS